MTGHAWILRFDHLNRTLELRAPRKGRGVSRWEGVAYDRDTGLTLAFDTTDTRRPSSAPAFVTQALVTAAFMSARLAETPPANDSDR